VLLATDWPKYGPDAGQTGHWTFDVPHPWSLVPECAGEPSQEGEAENGTRDGATTGRRRV